MLTFVLVFLDNYSLDNLYPKLYNGYMDKERVTTKIWKQSLHQLKVIAAVKKETMIDTLARLIDTEYKSIQKKGVKDEDHKGLQN
jgi:hypothetical protein